MSLSREQIITFSPDAASTKAADKIVSAQKIKKYYSKESIYWAEIQGSGSKSYQTMVSIATWKSKCNCPSRKFPCKHALATLLATLEENIEENKSDNFPEWVESWANKNIKKKETQSQDNPTAVNIPTKTIIEDKEKWDLANKASSEILIWLSDLISEGVLSLKNHQTLLTLDNLKKRMVDFKAPGFNRYLSDLEMVSYNADSSFTDEAMAIISELYLLANTVIKYDNYSDDYKWQLVQTLGWTIKKNDIIPTTDNILIDDWLVLAVDMEFQNSLTSRKVYLLGQKSKRFATIIDYSFRGSSFDDFFKENDCFEAKLILYPGLIQERVAIKLKGTHKNYPTQITLNTHTGWEDVWKTRSEKLESFIWHKTYNIAVANITIRSEDDTYYLKDNYGFELVCENSVLEMKNIIKKIGYLKTTVFGVLINTKFRLLAVWVGNKPYSIHAYKEELKRLDENQLTNGNEL